MKTLLGLFIALFTLFVTNVGAQTITNGAFTSGTTGWGCSPEVNTRATYGGTGTNNCAEVDAVAGLCQTVTGFTPGAIYRLTFTASRRTGSCPGPNPAVVNVTVSGGALSSSASRNNTTFALTTESFLFTASAASHTITISAAFTGTTCGFIVDDVALTLFSGLPVEFMGMSANCVSTPELGVELNWVTATETNNAYFTIQKSADGNSWETLGVVNGAGTTSMSNQYTYYDFSVNQVPVYYALYQTDFDGTTERLAVLHNTCRTQPNDPVMATLANGVLYSFASDLTGKLNVYTSSGQLVYTTTLNNVKQTALVTTNWQTGLYLIQIQSQDNKAFVFKHMVK